MSDVKVVDRRWWARGEGDAEATEARVGKPTYVEELERQLAEKDQLLQRYMEQYKAASTEFEESRIRARREVNREVERGKRTMLGELLEVVDNLDRAIDAGTAGASADRLLEGVTLVRSQFLSRLEGLGVAPIEALNQPFDPRWHEAVTIVPVSEPEQDGRVVGIIRTGYRIGEDVMRPALVAVGRKD
jgi:molecular chaperone GrpE